MSVSTKKVANLDEIFDTDADLVTDEVDAKGEQLVDELQPGTTLMHGQYTITKFLNNGGFGITYLAKDSLDRNVVIKECFPSAFCRRTNSIVSARSRAHQGELQSIVRLFVQEARSLSNVVHPNIVGVHQIFEDNDTAYMAIDYVDGKDLLDIIEEDAAALSPDHLVDITRKLLEAIGFVHAHDMLHRDISPDNILINSDGEPILIDFGAAREHTSNTKRAMSALRVVKDGYSPQEFYIAGGEQGPWSDLYSFAASLYHVISGAAPINGQSRLAAIADQTDDPYEPLAGRFDGYPGNFLEAIDKAMNVMPNKRMQSAGEWLEMLNQAQGNGKSSDAEIPAIVTQLLEEEATKVSSAALLPELVVAQTEAPISTASEVVTKPSKTRPRLLAGCSAIVFMAGLGYVVYQSFGASAVELADVDDARPLADVVMETGKALAETLEQPSDRADAPSASTEAVETPRENEAQAEFSKATAVAVEALSESRRDKAASLSDAEQGLVVEKGVPDPSSQTGKKYAEDEPLELASEAQPEGEKAKQKVVSQPSSTVAEPVIDEAAPLAKEVDVLPQTVEALATDVTSDVDVTGTPPGISQTQITLAVWDVLMPFESSLAQVRNAQTALITKIADGADLNVSGDWIAEGNVIYALNGQPLDGQSTIATLILNDMATDPDGFTRIGVRFKDAQTGKFDRGLLAVPVVRNIWLVDGSLLQVRLRNGAWVTEVAIVGDQSGGTLKKGDILTKEGVTGRTISAPEDIEAIIEKLVELQRGTAKFSVLRSGKNASAELPLSMSR